MTHSRRDFLFTSGGGLGGLALTQLLADAGELPGGNKPKAALNGGLHHVAKVKRVVQLSEKMRMTVSRTPGEKGKTP